MRITWNSSAPTQNIQQMLVKLRSAPKPVHGKSLELKNHVLFKMEAILLHIFLGSRYLYEQLTKFLCEDHICIDWKWKSLFLQVLFKVLLTLDQLCIKFHIDSGNIYRVIQFSHILQSATISTQKQSFSNTIMHFSDINSSS